MRKKMSGYQIAKKLQNNERRNKARISKILKSAAIAAVVVSRMAGPFASFQPAVAIESPPAYIQQTAAGLDGEAEPSFEVDAEEGKLTILGVSEENPLVLYYQRDGVWFWTEFSEAGEYKLPAGADSASITERAPDYDVSISQESSGNNNNKLGGSESSIPAYDLDGNLVAYAVENKNVGSNISNLYELFSPDENGNPDMSNKLGQIIVYKNDTIIIDLYVEMSLSLRWQDKQFYKYCTVYGKGQHVLPVDEKVSGVWYLAMREGEENPPKYDDDAGFFDGDPGEPGLLDPDPETDADADA
ncbi:MAG: hypothetical protein FWE85_00610, partial [Clostridiales bacterium]|nr:hypothetical protein [Clostridiales bacterium]